MLFRSGADAEDEAALREVIEHRRVGSDERRMRVRQVRGAGRELDVFRRVYQRRQKNETVGDVLGFLREMLAHEGVVKTQLVGENDRFAVFLQRLGGRTMRGMQRHREIAKSHVGLGIGRQW